jgi:tetratricopeptide (TPR) repeat protein
MNVAFFSGGGKTPEDEVLAMNLAIYLKEMWKQSDFCRLNWQAAEIGLIPQVDLRIGIGSGEVALDYDVWSRTKTPEGISISEAKRIEGQADEASETLIMVKWDVREACTGAGVEVEFGPLIWLKGKGVPTFGEIPVCPVKTYAEWEPIQKRLVPSPKTYFERLSHAVALRRSGDLEGAIKEYGELLKLRPDDPDALNYRGIALGHLQRYEEELADYNRSLALRPDDPDTLNNRGIAFRRLQRYEEALADYNRSLELRPDHPNTLNNRGNALSDLGRHQEALADYNRSLELRPDDPSTLNNRGLALGYLQRYAEALADFNRSLELRPDHADTIYNTACLYSLWERYDEALQWLDKAIARDASCRRDAAGDEDFAGLRADPEFGPRFEKLIQEETP